MSSVIPPSLEVPQERSVKRSRDKSWAHLYPSIVFCRSMRSAMKAHSSRNVRLLAHHPLDGFGNCGEGMASQRSRDGRRFLWITAESARKNVTAVAVRKPKKPALGTHTDLPHK